MSAIKKSGLKIFFPMFLLLIFSCSEQSKTDPKTKGEEVLKYIIYSKVGGKNGDYKTIKVTQDSILLDVGKTSSNWHRSWAKSLSETEKNEIFSQIKVYQLGFIKSSESQQFKNGTDETFQIKTTHSSYVFVNAYQDKDNYIQLQNFKLKIEKIIPKEFGKL